MESYGGQLRRTLDREGVTLRQLASKMNPRNPESTRRHLTRIMGGVEPRERTRQEIADALGVTRQDIEGDDEEADMVGDLILRVRELTEHTHELRRLVERVERKRA